MYSNWKKRSVTPGVEGKQKSPVTPGNSCRKPKSKRLFNPPLYIQRYDEALKAIEYYENCGYNLTKVSKPVSEVGSEDTINQLVQ